MQAGRHILDGDPALTGTSTGLSPTLLVDASEDWRPNDQLLGGILDSDTGMENDSAEIVGSTATSVEVPDGEDLTDGGQISQGAGCEITVDDPNHGSLPKADLDVTVAAFAECYVDVVTEDTIWDQDNVTFVRNLNYYPTQYRGSSSYEGHAFWIAYILTAFYSEHGWDHDPDGEMAVAGTSSTNEPEYARVFYETMQDMVVFGDGPEDKLARATCHEIGRQFESVDSPEDDDSIMYFRKTRAFSPQ